MEKTGKPFKDLMPKELKVVKDQATKVEKEAVTGEYLVCLFLLLADVERYGLHKTQLDSNFLMGN